MERYVKKAMTLLAGLYDNPLFIVFSNDIEWCRNHLTSVAEMRFIDWNTGEESYKDMIIMSKCNHNIIANSSFSWWAAWLNLHIDKRVIAPKIWYKGIPTSMIVPTQWMILED